MWNQAVSFFKRTKILGTACEFGLSLISLALSQCISHLGLNTNIKKRAFSMFSCVVGFVYSVCTE